MARTFHIRTYGCQMNVYDSQRMGDVLRPLGLVPTDDAETADIVILNTCHIREKAAEKVYSELGRLRLAKEQRARAGSPMILAVAGCVAQAEGQEIRVRAPFVDMVFGPQTYHRLPEMIARLGRDGGIVDVDFPVDPKFDHLPAATGVEGGAAFVTVQEGCDKFCSFCVVPYTRGSEYSRPVTAILEEAERLAAQGAVEITLLGQNVNTYHGPAPDGGNWGLGRLLTALADIPGLARLRYTTSHPADVDDPLIACHRDVEKLVPFLHLPVQSGSDRILAAMNRRHDADDYRLLADRLRKARPDLRLSSDFIVGFPGETDEDFAATLDLVAEVGFIQAFSFKYSPRPGTPAAAMPDQVPEAVKSERLAILQQRLEAGQAAFNQACIGRTLPVLFDRRGRHPGQLAGRSPWMQAVHAELPETALGTIRMVRIGAAFANSLGASAIGLGEASA